MRPLAHVLAGVGLTAAVWGAGGGAALALVAGGSTILWDLDHVLEYVFHYRSQASPRRFLKPGQASAWPYLVFFLHGHEWVLLLAGLAWYIASPVLAMVALGGGVHMLMDEWGNRRPHLRHRIHRLFYFFTFRLSRGFRSQAVSWYRRAGEEGV